MEMELDIPQTWALRSPQSRPVLPSAGPTEASLEPIPAKCSTRIMERSFTQQAEDQRWGTFGYLGVIEGEGGLAGTASGCCKL